MPISPIGPNEEKRVPWPHGRAPDTWDDVWPDWVPETVRAEIKKFYVFHGGPAGYERSACDPYHAAPAFGEVVTLSISISRSYTGRWVHAWNNIGRVVDDGGVSHVVSTCDYKRPSEE